MVIQFPVVTPEIIYTQATPNGLGKLHLHIYAFIHTQNNSGQRKGDHWFKGKGATWKKLGEENKAINGVLMF